MTYNPNPNPAQGEFPDVPAFRPAGSPLADAYGPSADQGEAKTFAALKALFSAPTEAPPAPVPAPPPGAAKAIASDIDKAQKAMDAEGDPVQKSILAQQLTQLRLKAAFTPGLLDGTATKAHVESDDEKLHGELPLCLNCHGAKTVANGNFERVKCPRCKGAGRVSPGDGAGNDAASKGSPIPGLSPLAAKLWADLARRRAAVQAAEKQVQSAGRLDLAIKSQSGGGMVSMAEFVRQTRNRR